MSRFKLVLAFVSGCVVTSLVAFAAVRVSAQADSDAGPVHVCVAQDGVMRMVAFDAGCPSGQRRLLLKKADPFINGSPPKDKNKSDDASSIDKTILEDLNRRLIALESLDCAAPGKSRVVAPFEVIDRAGKRVFVVTDSAAGLFDASGKAVARMQSDSDGGFFAAAGNESDAILGFATAVHGFGVSENSKLRIDLGKDLKRNNFRLRFFAQDGKEIAGIGQSTDGTGLANVCDIAGNVKATLRLGGDGLDKGLIGIANGSPIAELTEGDSKGGRLAIFNTNGDNMVVAGVDAGGFGVVRTGPESFKPGYGTLGLPGSFIMGKKQ